MIGTRRVILCAALAALFAAGCQKEEQMPVKEKAAGMEQAANADKAASQGTASPHGSASSGEMASPHGMPPAHATGTTPHPPTQGEQEAAHGGFDITGSAKKGETRVPDEVAATWGGATLIVVDRQTSKADEVTVQIGERHQLPGSNITLRVESFLPDLRIDNNIYTSVSNEPNNPAARVVIEEDGKEIFDGWLFSEFPQVHRFEHPRYGVTLKQGVKRSAT